MTSRTCRGLVLEEPRRLEARDFPVPEIGDDDALLKVEACGLCGTDHEQYQGFLPGPGAFVPGHESVGIVEAIGPRAEERMGVAAGARVALESFQRCGECSRCRAGDSRLCKRHGMRDAYGFVSVDVEPGLWGGYAQYQYLTPDSGVLRVPDVLDPALATMFNPLGAGIRWAVTVPETAEGDVVAILGPGIRGLCSVAAVREAGAGFVLVTGFGPRDHPRLELARKFGADVVVDVAEEDPVAALRREAGRLADVVVDVTAKAPAAFAQSLQMARNGGTVVVAGMRGGNDTPGFWPDIIPLKEVRILGVLGVDTPSYMAALELLASGRYPFADLPRKVVGLDGAADLLELMAGGTGEEPAPVHGVIDPWT
jgi:alcohol dehydrogenase